MYWSLQYQHVVELANFVIRVWKQLRETLVWLYCFVLYSRVLPSTVLPSTVLPSTVLPSTVFPSAVFPSAVLPSTVLPSTVLPSTVLPSTVLPSTVLPSTVFPSAVLPSTVLPSTVLPSTVLPSTVLPSTVLPSTVLPSTVLPSTVLPSTVLPSTVISGTVSHYYSTYMCMYKHFTHVVWSIISLSWFNGNTYLHYSQLSLPIHPRHEVFRKSLLPVTNAWMCSCVHSTFSLLHRTEHTTEGNVDICLYCELHYLCHLQLVFIPLVSVYICNIHWHTPIAQRDLGITACSHGRVHVWWSHGFLQHFKQTIIDSWNDRIVFCAGTLQYVNAVKPSTRDAAMVDWFLRETNTLYTIVGHLYMLSDLTMGHPSSVTCVHWTKRWSNHW